MTAEQVTDGQASGDSQLKVALLTCLDGLLATDGYPEGLTRGELGWLGDGLSDPQRESTSFRPARNRAEALNLVSVAQGLLLALQSAGEIPADAALQMNRSLDDTALRTGTALRLAQAQRIRGLYVIIDPEVTGGRDPLDIARSAINGGTRMLQLRDKTRDKGEQLPLARALQELCAAHDALLIINDHADLAAALGTENVGLHVGQTDLPVAEARKILAPDQALGRSNREIELIVESQEMGGGPCGLRPNVRDYHQTGDARSARAGTIAASPSRRPGSVGGYRRHHRPERRARGRSRGRRDLRYRRGGQRPGSRSGRSGADRGDPGGRRTDLSGRT